MGELIKQHRYFVDLSSHRHATSMTRPTWYQCQQRHNVEVLLTFYSLSLSLPFDAHDSRNRCINPAGFSLCAALCGDARIVLPSFTHTHTFIITGSVSIQANLQSTEASTNNGVTNAIPIPSILLLSLSIPVLWNRVNRVVHVLFHRIISVHQLFFLILIEF